MDCLQQSGIFSKEGPEHVEGLHSWNQFLCHWGYPKTCVYGEQWDHRAALNLRALLVSDYPNDEALRGRARKRKYEARGYDIVEVPDRHKINAE